MVSFESPLKDESSEIKHLKVMTGEYWMNICYETQIFKIEIFYGRSKRRFTLFSDKNLKNLAEHKDVFNSSHIFLNCLSKS